MQGLITWLLYIITDIFWKNRHIFETRIHIQTQIRKNFILALVTNDFL